MTKTEAITTAKQFRVDADALLQRMKEHKENLSDLALEDTKGDLPCKLTATGHQRAVGEVIAQHTLSIRDLESCIMRQGMVLKSIGNENPYPNSYKPENTVVDPTADGLKL